MGHVETFNSWAKVAVMHAKTTDEGWDKQRLVIQVLIMLLCMHKYTGEDWDQYRHVFLVIKSVF